MPMRVAAALVKMATQKSLKSSSRPAQLCMTMEVFYYTFSNLTTRVLGLLHLLGLGEVQVEVHSYDGAVDTIDRRYALTLLEE